MNNSKTGITLLGDIVVPPVKVDIQYPFQYRVLANLEAPIFKGDMGQRRPKAGAVLVSYDIPAELKGGILSLANNHTMDFGELGLAATKERCRQLDIDIIGAGENVEKARAPLVFDSGGLKIGILACCEVQFGIATPWRPGVAPLDYTIFEVIRRFKTDVDIIIVSIHGSLELSAWPSPNWQDLLRSFIDCGATVVHGHHSHVSQGYEEYKNGLIFYGLGNFLIEPARWRHNPHAFWSIVCDIEFSKGSIKKWHTRTSMIEEKESVVVRESHKSENLGHQEYLKAANRPLKDRKLLMGLFQEVSVRLYETYNSRWLGFKGSKLKKNFMKFLKDAKEIHKPLSQRSKISARHYEKLLWYHLFACESHRDSIATALGVLSGELEDLRTSETKKLVDEMMPSIRDTVVESQR